MLSRDALLLLALALSLCGCGGSGVDPKAKESLERLNPRERTAAQALVELETAMRDENASALCSRVYVYEGSRRQCERSFQGLLDRQQTMAVQVRDVRLNGDSGLAHAAVTIVDNDGDRRTDNYTFQLIKAGGTWKVKFQ